MCWWSSLFALYFLLFFVYPHRPFLFFFLPNLTQQEEIVSYRGVFTDVANIFMDIQPQCNGTAGSCDVLCNGSSDEQLQVLPGLLVNKYGLYFESSRSWCIFVCVVFVSFLTFSCFSFVGMPCSFSSKRTNLGPWNCAERSPRGKRTSAYLPCAVFRPWIRLALTVG